MTTADLFVQMCQNLSQSPAEMEVKEQLRVVRAANAGIALFVESLPGIRRREETTAALELPQVKTITATQGSKDIVFDPTWVGQSDFLGRTVTLDADPGRYNRLQGVNSLLSAFAGTSGSTTMNIMSDAVLLASDGNLVDGEVILSWGTGNKRLLHGKPPAWQRENREYQYHTGEPERWWTEGLDGMTGGSNPLYVLRVWPQPAAAYDLIFSRRLWPAALSVADFESTAELPCLPREEQILVSLCQEGIISSPLWIGTANKEDSANEAASAKNWLDAKKGERGDTRRGKIRTKQGY